MIGTLITGLMDILCIQVELLSNNKISFTNNTGGTFNVTGISFQEGICNRSNNQIIGNENYILL